jgi:hypothetical protein
MDRVRFIEHRGVPILVSDLSGIVTTEELQGTVRRGVELAQTQPPGSVRVLVDVTGVEYNLEAFAIVQQSVAALRPHVRARAVVGLPAVATVPFEIVARISGRPMARFDDHEAAKEWLASQA